MCKHQIQMYKNVVWKKIIKYFKKKTENQKRDVFE